MPTYEYRCTECGHEFEMRQSFSASTEQECSKCGKVSRRRISAVPVIFKGSGWYVTDYAGKSGSSTDSVPGKRTPEKEEFGKTETATAFTSTEKPKSEPAKTEAPKAETRKTETKTSTSTSSFKPSE